MRLLVVVCLCASLTYAGQEPAAPQPGNQNQAEKKNSAEKSNITIPAGSKVILSMTSPVWSKTVKEGDSVYAISAFPVAINNQMAIPPGTYAQGVIDAVTKPTRKTNQAVFLMHFTKLIFANGYAGRGAGGCGGGDPERAVRVRLSQRTCLERAKPGFTPGLRLVQGSEDGARDNTPSPVVGRFRKDSRGPVHRGVLRGTLLAARQQGRGEEACVRWRGAMEAGVSSQKGGDGYRQWKAPAGSEPCVAAAPANTDSPS